MDDEVKGSRNSNNSTTIADSSIEKGRNTKAVGRKCFLVLIGSHELGVILERKTPQQSVVVLVQVSAMEHWTTSNHILH
jgi:hypothetical protein